MDGNASIQILFGFRLDCVKVQNQPGNNRQQLAFSFNLMDKILCCKENLN